MIEFLTYRLKSAIKFPILGIAIYPDDGKVHADLTSAADRAMYHAKTSQHQYFSFVSS